MTNRPEPWGGEPPREGWHFEAVESGAHWQAGSRGYHRCRRATRNEVCKAVPVACLNRGGSRPLWYAYCVEHMYGRWIEDGKVMCWRMVKDEIGAGEATGTKLEAAP